jgi:YHS domain-containing protein
MKRILLVLLVAALMAAILISAPMAFAQSNVGTSDANTSANKFFACYKGKTYKFNSKEQRRHFLKRHHSATKGRC